MSASVYTYAQKGAFALKVSGRNEGRYEAYCKRIGLPSDDPGTFVDDVTPDGRRSVKPSFFETRYFVRCDFEPGCSGAFVNHRLASVAEAFDFDGRTLVGTFDFANAPGKFCFEIVWYRNGRRESAAFEWMVVSEKLDVQKDYTAIVSTIEANAPGLVRAFLAKSKGQAGLIRRGDTNDAVWADIFCEVAERYRRACEWVASRPHLKYVAEVEYRRAGLVRRWTPALVNRYATMPPGRRSAALFRTEHVSPETDTVENRFVKHTLKVIRARLAAFAAECRKHPTVSDGFSNDLMARCEALGRIERKPFFAGVGRFTGFRQESLAMQRKQGYADVYATWVMLRKTLDTTKTGFSTGHRPISALYEFWCFLRISEVLEKSYGFSAPKGRIEGAKSYGDLFEEADEKDIDAPTLSALTYDYPEKDGVRVRLLYQQSYGRENAAGDLAYYNPQRPDIVLELVRDGETFTYLFDAKYRIDSRDEKDASPSEPINDMHRYRDAILYRQQTDKKLSRQVVGAYVLYPGRPLPDSYDYRDLIANENIGAIPLLPGDAGGAALEKFVGEILGKKTSAEHLEGDIPTRGTTVVVGEGFSEASIPTIELQPNEWPSLTDRLASSLKVPIAESVKIRRWPTLVRLCSNNKAEVIVKVLREHSSDATHKTYVIEWTPEGAL